MSRTKFPDFNKAPEWVALRRKMGVQEWAAVQTINGNYKLKTLAAADKAGDSIEQEFYGTKEEAQQQFKQHLKQLKEEGLL